MPRTAPRLQLRRRRHSGPHACVPTRSSTRLSTAADAGAALLAVATTVYGVVPRRQDLLRIAGLGLCLFLNQLLFILGLFLAGVTLASCMQPTIPVFTSVLSMLCGQEQPSSRRVAGVLRLTAKMVQG